MGTIFRDTGQVRALFDMYGVEMFDKSGDQIKSMAEKYLQGKQQEYKGHAYLDQIEKNAIYLAEGTYAVNLAIAQYLSKGEPVLRPEEVMGFVLQTRVMRPQQTMPYHLNYVRGGCTGCPVHNDHNRYANFRDLRVSGDWPKYIDELEFCCKYCQASYVISQQYLTAYLQSRELAASARHISPQELEEVVIERVLLRTDICMRNLQVHVGGPFTQSQLTRQGGKSSIKGSTKLKITTVEGLDSFINTGALALDNGLVSLEMHKLLDMFNAGTAAMRSGNLSDAIRIYRQMVSKEPRFVAPRCNLANCLYFSGNPREALQELKHAEQLAPRDIDICMSMARVYDSLGDSESEIQQYHKILDIDPDHIQALTNLGATYRSRSKYDLSEQFLTRALKQLATALGQTDNSQELSVQYNLALTYEAKDDWHRAIRCWKRCTELAPDDRFHQSLRKAEEQKNMQASVRFRYLEDGSIVVPEGYRATLRGPSISIGPFLGTVPESKYKGWLELGYRWELEKSE